MKVEKFVANFLVPNPTLNIYLRPYFLDILQLLFDQILKLIALINLFGVEICIFWSVQITTFDSLFVSADICLPPLHKLRLLLLLLLYMYLLWKCGIWNVLRSTFTTHIRYWGLRMVIILRIIIRDIALNRIILIISTLCSDAVYFIPYLSTVLLHF